MRNESHTGKLICRVNYYEAIFDTISDDDILAALAEVDQDQDPNTTSQSTIVVDVNDSEDESIIDDNDDDLAAFAEVVQDQDPNTTKAINTSHINTKLLFQSCKHFKHFVARVDLSNALHHGYCFWMHGHFS
ncbi:hypothetical protein KI688_013005 [Linnemannia hyalina]|uniref:Uncharacterized protein n=1 Tax=Linnemannia hyalina TaxID=64524 RepID=A0A9P7XPY7_9FUNG|nr:hypothetical protein KI688_003201 [Linnemannia hyalina]KAG9067092.1 hypothetical protein KI688_013005 [Linnemannia hyalina]